MEKIKLSITRQDFSKQREEVLYKVKESGIFDKFIKEYEITDAEIMKNASKFLRVLEENETCQNCQGINNCQKRNKKVHLELQFDSYGELILSLTPCKEQQKILNYDGLFIYRDFPNNNLVYDLKDTYNSDFQQVRRPLLNHLKEILTNGEKGVYLNGNRQSGKTFILSVFAKTFADKTNKKVAFIDSTRRIQELNDLYFKNKDEFEFIFSELVNAELVVFDDFGNEYKNEIVRDMIIFPLLNERYKNHKVTCFISNYSVSDIKIMYSLKEKISPKANQLAELIELLSKKIELKSLPYIE